jgi:ATP-binding cassette, subfamily B, bacterial MsbA
MIDHAGAGFNRPRPDQPGALKRIWGYVKPHSWMLIIALVFVAIVGVLEAATPFLIGIVFDTLLRASTTPTISIPVVDLHLKISTIDGRFVLLLLVVVTIVKAAAEYGCANTTAYVGQAVVRDLRNDLFERILYQPIGFFHFNPPGELISRISADVERIEAAAANTTADFMKQTAVLVFMVLTIFVIDWKLATISAVLAPLVFLPSAWFGRRLRTLSQSTQQGLAEMANILHEAVTGNRIVKTFTMEEAETAKFRKVTHRIFKVNLRGVMTWTFSSPLMEVLGVLVVAAFLLYARAQVANQRMTPGLFVAFVIGLIKLYDPVRRMSGINNVFQQAFGASTRIFQILSLKTETDSGQKHTPAEWTTIEFDDVDFAYEADQPVLQGISFKIRRGEVLAIVGASGAGKSTLVNLLPRFHDVTRGRILIDGGDVRELEMRSLRKQIAMVTQDVILFNDTVFSNIAYGDPLAGRDAVLHAAKAARVDNFVTDYEARVGERGLKLSGGERQRISIARALLKNAPILILDEATSSLDSESEALVQQALQTLMEGRTTIVIAHRLSTVRRADRIIVLADGRIKESGTHEELVVRRGLYWKLYNLQFQDVNS